MNLAAALTTFAVVLPAELPDKTALASLMLGSRYRPVYVFTGVAVAFTVHVVLAMVIGGLLGLLPHRVLSAVVAAAFGAGAVLLFFRRGEDEDVERATVRTPPTFWRVAAVSFGLIFLAEFGDLTQIVLVNLAARFHDPLAVGTGGLLALWAVAGLAIAGGRGLVRVIPIRLITLIGAGVMAVLAVISLVSAIAGLTRGQACVTGLASGDLNYLGPGRWVGAAHGQAVGQRKQPDDHVLARPGRRPWSESVSADHRPAPWLGRRRRSEPVRRRRRRRGGCGRGQSARAGA